MKREGKLFHPLWIALTAVALAGVIVFSVFIARAVRAGNESGELPVSVPSDAAVALYAEDEDTFVYATDAASVADKVDIIAEAPEGSLKTPVLYPVGLTEDKEASDSEAAAADAFLAYLQTDEALKVFEEYGFTPYKAEEKAEDAEENAETIEAAETEEAAE